MAIVGLKSRFLFIFFINSYPIIYILKIQFYKDLGFSEPVKSFINKRKQIPILNYNLIKSIIIDIKI
jgi:hypothetical protein